MDISTKQPDYDLDRKPELTLYPIPKNLQAIAPIGEKERQEEAQIDKRRKLQEIAWNMLQSAYERHNVAMEKDWHADSYRESFAVKEWFQAVERIGFVV